MRLSANEAERFAELRTRLERGDSVHVEINRLDYVVLWINHAGRPCFRVGNISPREEALVLKTGALAELRLAFAAMEKVISEAPSRTT